jgi:selenoprotein W-related protein
VGNTFDPGEKKFDVVIEYCVPCDLRATAISTASRLLKEYQHVIGSLKLVTGTGGAFEVTVNDQTVFSKKETGRVPNDGEILSEFEKLSSAA